MRVPRRTFLLSLAAASLQPRLWVNPSSPANTLKVELGGPVPVDDSHGDTWVPTWASDGKIYSPSDDTFGFHKATDSNVAFNCISGSAPAHLHGETVNPLPEYGKSTLEGPDGCTWKSGGCAFLEGALYLVVARHKYGETSGDANMRQTAANASIIRSTDFGRTWHRTAKENLEFPMFPGRRFAVPYFIQFGGVSNLAADDRRYVHAISNDGFWDNGDNLVLGRVRRDQIARLVSADWEYFAGKDRVGREAWRKNLADAKPVLENPGRLGMTGAVFVPCWRRYVMIGWYYPAGGGKLKGAAMETIWDFYSAPAPQGPWTKFASRNFFPQGYYSPQICPKFESPNRTFIWTAGNWNEPKNYKLTLVPLTFHAAPR